MFKAETIMEMFKEFLEQEYRDAIRSLKHTEDLEITKREIVDKAMARCCGTAFFMQNFAEFEEVDKVYNEYWHKFWDLLA